MLCIPIVQRSFRQTKCLRRLPEWAMAINTRSPQRIGQMKQGANANH
jgi:hypothetical protein